MLMSPAAPVPLNRVAEHPQIGMSAPSDVNVSGILLVVGWSWSRSKRKGSLRVWAWARTSTRRLPSWPCTGQHRPPLRGCPRRRQRVVIGPDSCRQPRILDSPNADTSATGRLRSKWSGRNTLSRARSPT